MAKQTHNPQANSGLRAEAVCCSRTNTLDKESCVPTRSGRPTTQAPHRRPIWHLGAEPDLNPTPFSGDLRCCETRIYVKGRKHERRHFDPEENILVSDQRRSIEEKRT